jgi:hypothetical protein
MANLLSLPAGGGSLPSNGAMLAPALGYTINLGHTFNAAPYEVPRNEHREVRQSAFGWLNSLELKTGATISPLTLPNSSVYLSEPLALLTTGLTGWVASDETAGWHSKLIESFRRWKTGSVVKDQSYFWQVFDAIECSGPFTADFLPLFTTAPSRWDSYYRNWLDEPDLLDRLQDWYLQRDLSTREIKSILETVVDELVALEGERSTAAIIACLRETFTREARARVKWRLVVATSDRVRNAPSTHEWVLGFIVHTGISPPNWAVRSRPSFGWALVSISNAQQVNHATIRRRQNSSNLRNTLCRRGTPAHLRVCSRDHSPFGRLTQPARCRRAWTNPSAAQWA